MEGFFFRGDCVCVCVRHKNRTCVLCPADSKHMNAFIEDILTRIQDLLELAPPVGDLRSLPHRCRPGRRINNCLICVQENGFPALLTSDDQLFMFETAGVLIVNGESPVERKQALMRSLLLPLMDAFRLLLAKLLQETEEERQTALADCLSHAVGFARSAVHISGFVPLSAASPLTPPPLFTVGPARRSATSRR